MKATELNTVLELFGGVVVAVGVARALDVPLDVPPFLAGLFGEPAPLDWRRVELVAAEGGSDRLGDYGR